ncbi:class I SAM-dependent methyltransferase [Dactylosporangium sp. NPDC000521]|uniref:class I SAM-dependent methyltransferase n=1 Tax=Dactylosporangium sp. NPDC000521 TaxID=3363975 RepID=UPI0036CE464B
MSILEISDLIVRHDPATGARLPVRRDDVLAALRAAGDRRGARIAEALPHRDGVLDTDAAERLLVRTHTELQRLNEELRIAEQLAELLGPLLAAVARDGERPRIVDVGCGIGYAIRWLATTGVLGDVELCGVDLNAALVAEASRLAEAEGLTCRFTHGDAFALPGGATVYISSGLLHHLRGDELGAFFRAQAAAGARAYCHFDIAATRLAPLGAWMFHRARMREPLGRHDGVASARRAHEDHALLEAARSAPGLEPLLHRPMRHSNPFCASVRPLLGVRPEHGPALRTALGPAARHLVAVSGPERRAW